MVLCNTPKVYKGRGIQQDQQQRQQEQQQRHQGAFADKENGAAATKASVQKRISFAEPEVEDDRVTAPQTKANIRAPVSM